MRTGERKNGVKTKTSILANVQEPKNWNPNFVTMATVSPADKPPSSEIKPQMVAGPALQISQEHCYSKLGPFRSSLTAAILPTETLFPTLAGTEPGLEEESAGTVKRLKKEDSESHGQGDADEVGTRSGERKEEEEEEEEEIDVVGVNPPVSLPYDENKVGIIMMECVKHINLVKVPPENSDVLLERVLLECGYQQRRLLSTLLRILQGDHLARLTSEQVVHEPIKRRLNNDRAVQQFRKALSDVNWDPKLVSWAHETLIQLLDTDLLPVYLDVLQILKSKCPVLVEQMIHSSLNLVGGEAFTLLLKRPWNPVVGMAPVDRQVHFDNPPLFITLPHTSMGLGGRRWRLWQSQLSTIGKVYPVIMPESLSDPAQAMGLVEFTEFMVAISLARVQELHHQFPTRPIVLLAWTLAGRIACKIAEVAPISCIVSLGLTSRGLHHKWEIQSDPFTHCKTPTIFIAGSEGTLTSVEYLEKLRATMPAPNSLIVVGGADDLLRLSFPDKYTEEVCQSIADRCMLEKIYKFMVYNISSSFPEENKPSRKRKASHNEDIGAAYLTPAASHSSIVLSAHADDSSWNCNLNNSNAFLKSFLSMRNSRSGLSSHSASPSPIPFDWKADTEGGSFPAVHVGELPKIGRPRSKSSVDKPKKKWPIRSRSKSSEQSASQAETPNSSSSLNTLQIHLNSNSNNNNSSEPSPPQLLSIPYASFRPLPITPPRNPFEDSSQKLNPKTLKQLQRR